MDDWVDLAIDIGGTLRRVLIVGVCLWSGMMIGLGMAIGWALA